MSIPSGPSGPPVTDSISDQGRHRYTWPPEQAVLGHLLDTHPRRIDSFALAAELRSCLERAQVDRAVTNLTEAGLLDRADGALVPSAAVLRFEALIA